MQEELIMWLISLAILAQSLDTYSTCNNIKNGRIELNPILGNTCKSAAVTKALMITPLLIYNKKRINIGLISAGTFGFIWNIK